MLNGEDVKRVRKKDVLRLKWPPLPPTLREDLRLDGYLEYPHAAKALQASIYSPGLEPRPYGTAVSVTYHYWIGDSPRVAEQYDVNIQTLTWRCDGRGNLVISGSSAGAIEDPPCRGGWLTILVFLLARCISLEKGVNSGDVLLT
ncbi:hypothetical protein TNCV_1853591 [Trichonephila clavipes]|nr:hypothetical protein TNCV_1853591 [Trichonephila clavipes]